MKGLLGLLIVFGSVAGGYVLSHGHLMALWQPFELIIIGGAAGGAFVLANPTPVVKAALGGIPGSFKPSPYDKSWYLDLLKLLYEMFTKARKEGLMAIEGDIEAPEESELFGRFERIKNDHHVLEFLCDYLRMVVSGGISPFELDNLMTAELDTHEKEAHAPAHALQQVADALPGFGIVAAVLGIVITMGMLGDPNTDSAAIGGHVAAALVGTFLGILLAYGVVSPLSQAVGQRAEEGGRALECIKACILAQQQGYNPQIAVEFGRKTMASDLRPSFAELEGHLRGEKDE
jgi:chemotaxis protein MotA